MDGIDLAGTISYLVERDRSDCLEQVSVVGVGGGVSTIGSVSTVVSGGVAVVRISKTIGVSIVLAFRFSFS